MASQVKNLERRTEEDVPYSDVARYLIAALTRFHQAARPYQQRESSSAAAHEEADERPASEETRRGSRRFERR